METIKIDKRSIKKNPDAGSQSSKIFAGSDITFTCTVTYDKFLELEKIREVIIHNWSEQMIGEAECIVEIEGSLYDISYKDKLPEGSVINQKMNYHTVTHLPIPEYSYNYLNTKVTCEDCSKKIPVDSIITEYNSHGYGYENDTTYQVCPSCHAINSFDYTYQKIEECL